MKINLLVIPVIIAIPFLGLAFSVIWRLMKTLKSKEMRRRWLLVECFVALFAVSYVGYVWVFFHQAFDWFEAPVSVLLLLGAIFVLWMSKISLRTTIDLKRMNTLESETMTDPLTKTRNRRFLEVRFAEEVSRARRYSLSLSILLIDIDYFKKINDRYGHAVGDSVLVRVSEVLEEGLRDLDMLTRYGGEEFLVICPNTAKEGAMVVAERLRVLVEESVFEEKTLNGELEGIKMSISIGVADFNVYLNHPDQMIRAADRALYQAKGDGRNRVIGFDPMQQTVPGNILGNSGF